MRFFVFFCIQKLARKHLLNANIRCIFNLCVSYYYQLCECNGMCHCVRVLCIQYVFVFVILGFALDKPLDMYVKVTLLSRTGCAAFISAMAHMRFLDMSYYRFICPGACLWLCERGWCGVACGGTWKRKQSQALITANGSDVLCKAACVDWWAC